MAVQLVKGIHQVVLENNNWKNAAHMQGARDPLARREFGGTHREMARIWGYQDAVQKLRAGVNAPRRYQDQNPNHAELGLGGGGAGGAGEGGDDAAKGDKGEEGKGKKPGKKK